MVVYPLPPSVGWQAGVVAWANGDPPTPAASIAATAMVPVTLWRAVRRPVAARLPPRALDPVTSCLPVPRPFAASPPIRSRLLLMDAPSLPTRPLVDSPAIALAGRRSARGLLLGIKPHCGIVFPHCGILR